MTRTTRYSRNRVLGMVREFESGDPWGDSMGWTFALCECLSFHGVELPPEAGFSWGIQGPHDLHQGEFPDCEVWPLYGSVPTEQLVFALRCLLRYQGWLKAAGMDY